MTSAAGRKFEPNMLYDATTDQIVPAFKVFDNPQITSKSHASSSMVYSTDESFKEKSSKLDVQGSMKLSILCGLVKVGGSVKYLNASAASHTKERVTLYFKGQTHVEELQVPTTYADQNHHICSLRRHATHVVTSVTYGGNAVCVFERDVSSSEEKNQAHGSGSASFDETVKKITSFLLDVSGEAKVDYSAEEKDSLKKVSFSYFGDFFSDKAVPNNFAEAQDFIRGLPSVIKATSVPVMVTLHPLEGFAAGCESNVS